MKPIEKNIIVTDEQGNVYEATYPKRAKGLVKNGRARFVSENKICLSVPPDKFLEDNKMTDITDNACNVAKMTAETQSKYSLDYALEQIEKISASTAYLDNTINELRQMEISNGVGDIANQAKAQALADVVRCRETTNQKLLDFYMKMVDELNPRAIEYKNKKFNALDQLMSHLTFMASESPNVVTDVLDTMRHIFKENFPV